MTWRPLFAALIVVSLSACDTTSVSEPTSNLTENESTVPMPPTDGVRLVKELNSKDSIALLQIDSQKPAKVAIYRCSITQTVHGPGLPAQITMSFLHFPDCRRMDVRSRYLCVVRHSGGDDYELVRSDMLAGAAKTSMYNCFWPAESDEATQVMAGANSNK